VGACTLDKDTINKIKSDLKAIFATGAKPNRVAYFCEPDIPVARRHAVQEFSLNCYGAALDVYDGHWIAGELSEADAFWIAQQFLAVPEGVLPATARTLIDQRFLVKKGATGISVGNRSLRD
jgi:hypothetical protein